MAYLAHNNNVLNFLVCCSRGKGPAGPGPTCAASTTCLALFGGNLKVCARAQRLDLTYLSEYHHSGLYGNMYGSTRSATGDGDYKRVAPRILRLANQLRELGVDSVLQLPTIVIAGDQSSGKSSVVEAIAGVALPRAEGTCTRCPTEVRMR